MNYFQDINDAQDFICKKIEPRKKNKKTHADKTQENNSQSVANALAQKRSNRKPAFLFGDNRAEAVVQRKQGRVKPTLQMESKLKVNDNIGLEKEADVMGQKALDEFRLKNKKWIMITKDKLPALQYDKWIDSRTTIHLILQIIGKAKLKLTPRKNHWWYMTLHPSSRGISTYSIPLHDGLDTLDMHFDIEERAVVLQSSDGMVCKVDLTSSPTVASFYTSFMIALEKFGLKPDFVKTPLDMAVKESFDQITNYHHYDWDSIKEFWKAMCWTKDVFQEFSGRFYGKTCPVHIYWHSLDLTVTRFSGKRLPNDGKKSGRLLERDSYSHEQISCGFWAGDPRVPQPMYYSYTFPSPESLNQEPLSPKEAGWIDSNGSPMATLSYQAVRESHDPRSALLEFLESSYQAGAKKAGWDIKKLTAPPLSEI